MNKTRHTSWFVAHAPALWPIWRKEIARTRSGVTLIELMIVAVMMVMIMSIAIAGFSGMSRGATRRGAVNSLASAITLARQHAVNRRETVWFTSMPRDPATTNPAYFVVSNDYGEVIVRRTDLPLGIDVSPVQFAFASDGTVKGQVGAIYIEVQELLGDRVMATNSIGLYPLTGGVVFR